jgi:hypothetical protein
MPQPPTLASALDRVDGNAEPVRGDLGKAVQQLKRESGKGLRVGGVKLPLALTELGLIDDTSSWCSPDQVAVALVAVTNICNCGCVAM